MQIEFEHIFIWCKESYWKQL